VFKAILTSSALLLLGLLVSAQQPPPPPAGAQAAPYVIPANAAKEPNPVPATLESLAQGKKWYGYDCAMCHGANGDGKGDMAADSKTKVSDFTTALKTRTDGEIFYIIQNGKGDMPAEGQRLKSTELWNLVNYVRSLAKKKAAPDEKAPAEQKGPAENKSSQQ